MGGNMMKEENDQSRIMATFLQVIPKSQQTGKL